MTDLSQWLQTLGSSKLRENVMQGRKKNATANRIVLWPRTAMVISVRAAPSDKAGGDMLTDAALKKS